MYNTIVLPHLDYGAVVWATANLTSIRVIKQLQKRAARIILGARKYTSSELLLNKLGWLPFEARVDYHRAVLVYKALNNQAPQYICNKFSLQSSSYNTRSVTQLTLKVPKPRLEAYRKSFIYTGATLWNKLPSSVKDCKSIGCFKRSLSAYMAIK